MGGTWLESIGNDHLCQAEVKVGGRIVVFLSASSFGPLLDFQNWQLELRYKNLKNKKIKTLYLAWLGKVFK